MDIGSTDSNHRSSTSSKHASSSDLSRLLVPKTVFPLFQNSLWRSNPYLARFYPYLLRLLGMEGYSGDWRPADPASGNAFVFRWGPLFEDCRGDAFALPQCSCLPGIRRSHHGWVKPARAPLRHQAATFENGWDTLQLLVPRHLPGVPRRLPGEDWW